MSLFNKAEDAVPCFIDEGMRSSVITLETEVPTYLFLDMLFTHKDKKKGAEAPFIMTQVMLMWEVSLQYLDITYSLQPQDMHHVDYSQSYTLWFLR